jgi:hypothetical protein
MNTYRARDLQREVAKEFLEKARVRVLMEKGLIGKEPYSHRSSEWHDDNYIYKQLDPERVAITKEIGYSGKNYHEYPYSEHHSQSTTASPEQAYRHLVKQMSGDEVIRATPGAQRKDYMIDLPADVSSMERAAVMEYLREAAMQNLAVRFGSQG